VEIKVGVKGAPRELVVDSPQTAAEIRTKIETAVKAGDGLLVLDDAHGRQILVPIDKLAYVEIGEPETRRVGFGAL
jgi:Protein of unknown function (DUF3107)